MIFCYHLLKKGGKPRIMKDIFLISKEAHISSPSSQVPSTFFRIEWEQLLPFFQWLKKWNDRYRSVLDIYMYIKLITKFDQKVTQSSESRDSQFFKIYLSVFKYFPKFSHFIKYWPSVVTQFKKNLYLQTNFVLVWLQLVAFYLLLQ